MAYLGLRDTQRAKIKLSFARHQIVRKSYWAREINLVLACGIKCFHEYLLQDLPRLTTIRTVPIGEARHGYCELVLVRTEEAHRASDSECDHVEVANLRELA